jgi:hypothetical protein
MLPEDAAEQTTAVREAAGPEQSGEVAEHATVRRERLLDCVRARWLCRMLRHSTDDHRKGGSYRASSRSRVDIELLADLGDLVGPEVLLHRF